MLDEQKWPLLHLYRKASVRGDVPTMVCPEEDAELIPKLGYNGDPVLTCFACGSTYTINVYMWENMQRNLKEVYETVEFDWSPE